MYFSYIKQNLQIYKEAEERGIYPAAKVLENLVSKLVSDALHVSVRVYWKKEDQLFYMFTHKNLAPNIQAVWCLKMDVNSAHYIWKPEKIRRKRVP